MAEQNIIGGRQLYEFLQALPVKIERNILRAGLRAGAVVIRDAAREKVPVKLGALRKSIRVTVGSKRGIVTASVKAGNKDAFYWRFVEYGTKAHLIKVSIGEMPINYRLTAKRGKLTYMSMTTVNRNILKIGNTFVGPVVSHPGAKPSPFMRPALDEKGDAAVRAVVEKIRERLTKEGINVPAPEEE
jgi:HK97 gp10 family phage protein